MFEKIINTINNTGKAVGEKTKQSSDIVKANFKISSEERALIDLYCEIGKTYYDKNSDNPCCEEMKALFDKVAEKASLIEELKQQIRLLKGQVVCDNCGTEVSIENDYCGKCGAKLTKPEPVEEPTAEKAEEVIDHENPVEVTDENGEASINIEVAVNKETETTDTEE